MLQETNALHQTFEQKLLILTRLINAVRPIAAHAVAFVKVTFY